MLDRMLNTPSMRYLEKGLDTAWLRNEIIADNIANVDTPNFTASHVEFETLLKSAMEDGNFDNRRTRPEHIEFGSNWEDVSAIVVEDLDTDMRMDGNNVDVEAQMIELARNTLHYNSMVQKLTSEFTRMRTAITG